MVGVQGNKSEIVISNGKHGPERFGHPDRVKRGAERTGHDPNFSKVQTGGFLDPVKIHLGEFFCGTGKRGKFIFVQRKKIVLEWWKIEINLHVLSLPGGQDRFLQAVCRLAIDQIRPGGLETLCLLKA